MSARDDACSATCSLPVCSAVSSCATPDSIVTPQKMVNLTPCSEVAHYLRPLLSLWCRGRGVLLTMCRVLLTLSVSRAEVVVEHNEGGKIQALRFKKADGVEGENKQQTRRGKPNWRRVLFYLPSQHQVLSFTSLFLFYSQLAPSFPPSSFSSFPSPHYSTISLSYSAPSQLSVFPSLSLSLLEISDHSASEGGGGVAQRRR